jgi:hypothetical protein
MIYFKLKDWRVSGVSKSEITVLKNPEPSNDKEYKLIYSQSGLFTQMIS